MKLKLLALVSLLIGLAMHGFAQAAEAERSAARIVAWAADIISSAGTWRDAAMTATAVATRAAMRAVRGVRRREVEACDTIGAASLRDARVASRIVGEGFPRTTGFLPGSVG
jgi:hypothetical protein